MKVVKVYGALRELLGKTRFEFVADTPAQAMRALLVNYPQLEQWLIDSERDGVAYRVTVGKQKIYEQDVSGMLLPWSEREVFSIAPVLTGAGRGVGTFLLGAALVGVAIFSAGAGFSLAAGGFTTTGVAASGAVGVIAPGFAAASALAAVAGNIGIGLMLTGVAQMLSPVPKPPGPAEAPTQLESNSFSGIVNTSRQGIPVPIAYGRVFVGSAVISSGLDVDRIK
jgi:predicted phage tail protein|tara:strand:- start:1626 stop:2300 length:675 start_codon:yes stop_codon:yes gene_type:complete